MYIYEKFTNIFKNLQKEKKTNDIEIHWLTIFNNSKYVLAQNNFKTCALNGVTPVTLA